MRTLEENNNDIELLQSRLKRQVLKKDKLLSEIRKIKTDLKTAQTERRNIELEDTSQHLKALQKDIDSAKRGEKISFRTKYRERDFFWNLNNGYQYTEGRSISGKVRTHLTQDEWLLELFRTRVEIKRENQRPDDESI